MANGPVKAAVAGADGGGTMGCMPEEHHDPAISEDAAGTVDVFTEVRPEEALLKTGALQNAIFNSANFSSIATDEKGVIQLFNVGAERMLGYAAAEVLNKITPADISDPQEVIARAKALSLELGTGIAPGFEALVFKASRGIEDIYELTYIRKDGSRFPAVVSVTALRDDQGAIIGYLLIGTDNSARKRAEEALLKAGALQAAIFNSANFWSIATDEKGVIQLFNVGAERMLGYTAAEVLNKITPADISDLQEVIARAKALSLEFGIPIRPGFGAWVFKASRGIEDIYELTYVRKDGSRFPAVVSVTALRDAQDAILGYLLIGTDNTARKRMEQALLNSEKLAATARLASTMAHEINNPLGAITNLIYLLAPLQSSPEAQAYIATLDHQVRGLSRIATQMLKFHRDNNQPTEFKLEELVREVANFYRPQAERQGIVVDQRLETEGIIVGYSGEIVQVVTNLLLNALEATPSGGKIILHLYPAPPWLCKVHGQCGYCLSVADTGSGIDPQHYARLFEPFFTTKGDKGTGLGLWLCMGIVSRVSGSMRVWSTRRPGRARTCFPVFLPAEEATFTPLRRRYERE